MEIAYSLEAKEDIIFWKTSGNNKIMNRISILIEAIKASPYEGIGKPEALKYKLSGFWSRRINREHRIIYEVINDRIIIHSLTWSLLAYIHFRVFTTLI